MLPFSKPQKLNKYLVCSQELSGYGFSKMLLDQSTGRGPSRNQGGVEDVILAVQPKDDEDDFEHLEKVGDGVVTKMDLDECFKNRKDYKDYLWVFDMNFGHEMADTLRKEGYYVIGGQEFTDKLEHDREYGLSLIKKAGLDEPTSHTFNDIQSGLELIESDPLIAWVFKPNEPDNESWVTTTPDSDNDEQANREMYRFLSAQTEGKGDYILQERVKGIEINVEMWLYKGTPFFSFANFECKRKDNGDHGRMIGCAQDIGFKIDLQSKILKDTLWKLVSLPEFSDYTGMIDLNLIIADNKYYFLEFCGRFGYNSHPNLFLTLSIEPISTVLSDFVLGNIKDFQSHFRDGFGASITTWIDKPVAGLPLMFDNDQDVESRFYHFDTFRENDEWFLAGYANETGIICAHDYDIHSAADECLRKFNKIHYPGKTGRTDLVLKNYQSNPEERYIACQSMKLFDKGDTNT